MPAPAGAHYRSDAERRAALGPLEGLPAPLRRALSPEGFAPLPRPGSHDWLAAHPEPGQSFAAFVRSGPNRPDARRSTLYLLPLGDLSGSAGPPPEQIRAYAEAYFAMPARLLPAVPLDAVRATSRVHRSTGRRQLLTTDILSFLEGRLPEDAFCLAAFTLEDLYPDPSWNFVFGQASLQVRVGVYSFARYDPAFYGKPRGPDYRWLLLRRSLKVMAHAVAHMFGLHHCMYYACGLNGSNHLEEADSRPPALCPVCLRKLWHSVRFDVVKRYEALESFYQAAGLIDDAAWVRERLRSLRG
jgi:archaemetzincin